jgi:hypothetical protein
MDENKSIKFSANRQRCSDVHQPRVLSQEEQNKVASLGRSQRTRDIGGERSDWSVQSKYDFSYYSNVSMIPRYFSAVT